MDHVAKSVEHDLSAASSEAQSRVDDNWVRELIAMTRPGVEIQFPVRQINERQIPFVYDDFR